MSDPQNSPLFTPNECLGFYPDSIKLSHIITIAWYSSKIATSFPDSSNPCIAQSERCWKVVPQVCSATHDGSKCLHRIQVALPFPYLGLMESIQSDPSNLGQPCWYFMILQYVHISLHIDFHISLCIMYVYIYIIYIVLYIYVWLILLCIRVYIYM